MLYPYLSSSSVDFAIGVEAGSLWQSVGTTSDGFETGMAELTLMMNLTNNVLKCHDWL